MIIKNIIRSSISRVGKVKEVNRDYKVNKEIVPSHKDLKVWQVYEIVRFFPEEEMYSLSSQIKRASILIPSNIAEGAGW